VNVGRQLARVVLLALCAGGTAGHAATAVADPLMAKAVRVHNIERNVLLGITMAGSRVVAVGERGSVALSDDGGITWRQAQLVPVSVTLTAVRFVDARQGWAVGHAGVVLHTSDAGETWAVQLDGIQLARTALQAAQAKAREAGPDNAAAQRELRNAQLLVDDGPDKPFFDLDFADPLHGIVVGAYNLVYATSDGGATWQAWSGRTENPKALHLYAVQRQGKAIYLAGEQGLFLRSADEGQSFTRVTTPYQGSWFSITAPAAGSILLAGLRGNAYRSRDDAKTWDRLTGAAPVSFVSVQATDGQTAVLANQAGQLFMADSAATALRPMSAPPLPMLTALLVKADRSYLALTVQGVRRFPPSNAPLPKPAASASGAAK
jgi:photosystem II stability/assembly factor-like uncharacterized protein